MSTHVRSLILIATVCTAACIPRDAGAEQVAPGVTFTQYDVAGPNRVHVVAVERLRSEYKLEVGWPAKRRNFTSRQTVGTIAGLYDQPPDHDVVAAVNASFFSTPPAITGTAPRPGKYSNRPPAPARRSSSAPPACR